MYITLPAGSTVSVWPSFAVCACAHKLLMDKQSLMPHIYTYIAQLSVAYSMVKGLVHFSFTLAGKWERGYLIRTAKTQSTELAMLAHTRTVQGRRDNKKGWNVFLHVVNIISCTLCMYMYMSCILRVHKYCIL